MSRLKGTSNRCLRCNKKVSTKDNRNYYHKASRKDHPLIELYQLINGKGNDYRQLCEECFDWLFEIPPRRISI